MNAYSHSSDDKKPYSAANRETSQHLRAPVQRKENRTGLPDNLKAGLEKLSNFSMDDVQVHYNSDKPAQLQARAYAQGTDIHVAPGQERHLPHEAWHVVQQKQGRVKPTMQMKGKIHVNDATELENEADTMGSKALQLNNSSGTQSLGTPVNTTLSTVQLVGDEDKKKGEDYCNNIGKSIQKAVSSLPDFLDEAITAAIDIINANRHLCSVSSHLVTGEDTNTLDFGNFVTELNSITERIRWLIPETDYRYSAREIKSFGSTLMQLLDTIPEVAIDLRVAEVIANGVEGDRDALEAINAALINLKKALKMRFRSYLTNLVESKKPPKEDKDSDPGPDSGGLGGTIPTVEAVS